MLERARAKSADVEWVRGDVLALPFDDASFDAATIGFGMRNVDDLDAGLRELRRVLRPGGRIGILEITQPRGAARALLPPVVRPRRPAPRQGASRRGRVHVSPGERPPLPGAGASSRRCLESAGFTAVRFRLFAGGIVALHVAEAGQ